MLRLCSTPYRGQRHPRSRLYRFSHDVSITHDCPCRTKSFGTHRMTLFDFLLVSVCKPRAKLHRSPLIRSKPYGYLHSYQPTSRHPDWNAEGAIELLSAVRRRPSSPRTDSTCCDDLRRCSSSPIQALTWNRLPAICTSAARARRPFITIECGEKSADSITFDYRRPD